MKPRTWPPSSDRPECYDSRQACARLNVNTPIRSVRSPAFRAPASHDGGPPSSSSANDFSSELSSSDIRSAVPFLWEHTPGRRKSSASTTDLYNHDSSSTAAAVADPPFSFGNLCRQPVTLAALFRQSVSSPPPSCSAVDDNDDDDNGSVATSDALTATGDALSNDDENSANSGSGRDRVFPRSSSYARHVIVNRFLPAANAMAATDSPAAGPWKCRSNTASDLGQRNKLPLRQQQPLSADDGESTSDHDADDDSEEDSGIVASIGACGISCTIRMTNTVLSYPFRSKQRRRRLIRESGRSSVRRLADVLDDDDNDDDDRFRLRSDRKHQWSCGELQKEANKASYHTPKPIQVHDLTTRDNDEQPQQEVSIASRKGSKYFNTMSKYTFDESSSLPNEEVVINSNNNLSILKANNDISGNVSTNLLSLPLPKSPTHSWLDRTIPLSIKSPSPLSCPQGPKKEQSGASK